MFICMYVCLDELSLSPSMDAPAYTQYMCVRLMVCVYVGVLCVALSHRRRDVNRIWPNCVHNSDARKVLGQTNRYMNDTRREMLWCRRHDDDHYDDDDDHDGSSYICIHNTHAYKYYTSICVNILYAVSKQIWKHINYMAGWRTPHRTTQTSERVFKWAMGGRQNSIIEHAQSSDARWQHNAVQSCRFLCFCVSFRLFG